MPPELMAAMLNSLKDPFMFVDTDHIIRYINKAAIEKYSKRGGADFIGRSVLDCHNETSCASIIEIAAAMPNGLEEQLIADNEKHRIFMRAVRDEDGDSSATTNATNHPRGLEGNYRESTKRKKYEKGKGRPSGMIDAALEI